MEETGWRRPFDHEMALPDGLPRASHAAGRGRHDVQLSAIKRGVVCTARPQTIPIRRKFVTTGEYPGSRSQPSEKCGRDIKKHRHSAVPIRS